jgi:hypothetical protein
MNGTCKDCMYWVDVCGKAPEGWKACRNDELVSACYGDHVITAPNFGCVQFESVGELSEIESE